MKGAMRSCTTKEQRTCHGTTRGTPAFCRACATPVSRPGAIVEDILVAPVGGRIPPVTEGRSVRLRRHSTHTEVRASMR
jgi:hypothetical protein